MSSQNGCAPPSGADTVSSIPPPRHPHTTPQATPPHRSQSRTVNGTRGAHPQQQQQQHALDKAHALVEALPWLGRFRGKTIVVKYGGHAMADPVLRDFFAKDIVFLCYAGVRVIVVHGGGPQINAVLDRLGVETAFRCGLRITSPETMDVVRMVLVGQVNRDIVGLINAHGPFAIGMSGEDAHLMTAARRHAVVDGEHVDVGLVGDVVAVRTDTVLSLLDRGHIPVIASVARGLDEAVLNVNADTAAAALAVAVGAQKLVMLTDVEGLCPDWPNSEEVLSRVSADDLELLLPFLTDGMAPKMEACLRAARAGVPEAHVLDGRVPNAILLNLFTDVGTGTLITPR